MSKEIKHTSSSKIESQEKGVVTIVATIPAEVLTKARPKALKSLQETVKIDGFRDGKIPEKVLVERVGEMNILEEALNEVLPKVIAEIFVEHKVNGIGRPEINVTKLAIGSDVEIKVSTTVYPEIAKLPDYTKIAKSVYSAEEKVEVTDADLEKLIADIRKMKARYDHKKMHDEGKEHDHEAMEKAEADAEKGENLPELTDEFVQTVGPYKTVDEFKTEARKSLLEEKKQRAAQKKRGEVIEKIVEKTEVEVPELLISYELERMFARLSDDVARFKLTIEDYLAQVKKTREDLEKEWHDDARKNVVTQLVLSAIAEKEKLVPAAEDVQKQTEMILAEHKDVLPDRVRSYVDMMLTNEKVFAFLEKGEK